MKTLFFLLFTAISISVFAQKNEEVSLTVLGDGQTKEEALQNALRNAIEQAYGTFISSNTQILNDRLIKDEIVSVSNGNIKKYDIISETQINGRFNTTLKAIVSVSKLTTFCKNKGITVEFEGALFASNIKLQQLYANNEKIAINNLITVLKSVIAKSFDYEIKTDEPVKGKKENWVVKIQVSVFANSNFKSLIDITTKTLNSLALSKDEVQNFVDLGKRVFAVSIDLDGKKSLYFLRSENSKEELVKFFSIEGNANKNENFRKPPENMSKYLRNFDVIVVKNDGQIKLDGQSQTNRDQPELKNQGKENDYYRWNFTWDFNGNNHSRANVYCLASDGSGHFGKEGTEYTNSTIYFTKQKEITKFSYWSYDPKGYHAGSNDERYISGIYFSLDEIGKIKNFQIKPKTNY